MKAIYTPQQHEAMAVNAEKMTAQQVVELAAAGKLVLNGEPLPPFKTTRSTVSTVKGRRRRRRAGEAKSELANVPARDGVEELRRRYLAAADHEMKLVEELQRAGERVNLEQLRQVGRVVLELSRIPGPSDPPPPSPDTRGPNGRKLHGRTRGGLAAEAGVGPLLRAHRGEVESDPPTEPLTPAPRPGSEHEVVSAADATHDSRESLPRSNSQGAPPRSIEPEPEPMPAFVRDRLAALGVAPGAAREGPTADPQSAPPRRRGRRP